MTFAASLCWLGLSLAAFAAATLPGGKEEGEKPFAVNSFTANQTSCRKYQFECKSGFCVDLHLLCNGAEDCDDASDETEAACGNIRCPQYAFQCKYGACVNKDAKCNGISDCADGSDESHKICSNNAAIPSSNAASPSRGNRLIRATSSWNPEDCGKYRQNQVALDRDIGRTQGTSLPWYARVYKRDGSSFRYVGGGTIVSPTIIISVASIFWNEARRGKEDVSMFRISVGRFDRRNNEKQFRVKDVHIPEKFTGVVGYYEHDISVVILDSEIELNDNINPICIDFNNTYSEFLIPGKRGLVGGWGGNPDNGTLGINFVPVVPAVECDANLPQSFRPFLTFDKFCAGLLNVTTLCKGDSGGGFATEFRDKKWYLSGILSVGHRTGTEECSDKFYFGYTKVTEHSDFVMKYTFGASTPRPQPTSPPTTSTQRPRPPPIPAEPDEQGKGQCRLPDTPENGSYRVIGSRRGQPGSAISVGSVLIFSCNNGYVMQGSQISECKQNGWSPSPPVCSTVMCHALQDSSRDIDCVLKGQDIKCSSPMPPESKASVKCKTHYETVPTLTTYDMICQNDGQWNRQLQSCASKCGEPTPSGALLVASGEPSKKTEFPWHIGLYKYNKDNALEVQCGGTIVSTRIIVTAAHCFPEDLSSNLNNVISQYRAVAGKYEREWSKTSRYTQHLNIDTVVLHPNYRGSSRNYVNDIALVILKEQILVNEVVKPLCVDYDKFYFRYFTPGIKGSIVGWGLTEHQKPSDVLLTAELPYVRQEECENSLPSNFHDFLIGDKFCAGKDKTTACQGDSGGGYAVKFPHSTRWYLTGVVSIGPTENCGLFPYAAFSGVYNHLDFIRDYVYQYV